MRDYHFITFYKLHVATCLHIHLHFQEILYLFKKRKENQRQHFIFFIYNSFQNYALAHFIYHVSYVHNSAG